MPTNSWTWFLKPTVANYSDFSFLPSGHPGPISLFHSRSSCHIHSWISALASCPCSNHSTEGPVTMAQTHCAIASESAHELRSQRPWFLTPTTKDWEISLLIEDVFSLKVVHSERQCLWSRVMEWDNQPLTHWVVLGPWAVSDSSGWPVTCGQRTVRHCRESGPIQQTKPGRE